MQPCPTCGSDKPHSGACPGAVDSAAAKPLFVDSQHIVAGTVLQGRYEILHMLGQGGMGTVFMARDLRLKGRSCVVKKLRDDYFRAEDKAKAQEFFEREMEVLSGIDTDLCPSIVRIQDFFTENGRFFLVMDYVQGNNLHFMLHEERKGEPFAEETVLKWAQQICDVLIYLHDQHPPIIYRDLKPSNVMIDVKGSVKLVDFGIARRAEGGENTHVVSAGYSPPEQYWGAASAGSDIYALGATMHFLLTGQDPEALHVCSPRSINPDISEGVDKLVQKCTAQEPGERYQTAQELWEALLNTEREAPPQSARSRVWEAVAGVLVLVVGSFMYYQVLGNSPQQPAGVEPPPHMLTGVEDQLSDPRAQHANKNKGKLDAANNQTPDTTVHNQADLAVQVTDERELTDPAGLPENVKSKSPVPQSSERKTGTSFFSLFNDTK